MKNEKLENAVETAIKMVAERTSIFESFVINKKQNANAGVGRIEGTFSFNGEETPVRYFLEWDDENILRLDIDTPNDVATHFFKTAGEERIEVLDYVGNELDVVNTIEPFEDHSIEESIALYIKNATNEIIISEIGTFLYFS